MSVLELLKGITEQFATQPRWMQWKVHLRTVEDTINTKINK